MTGPREQYAASIGRDDVASGEVWLEVDHDYVAWLERRVAELAEQLGRAEQLLGKAERYLRRHVGGRDEVERLEAERYGPPPRYPSTPPGPPHPADALLDRLDARGADHA